MVDMVQYYILFHVELSTRRMTYCGVVPRIRLCLFGLERRGVGIDPWLNGEVVSNRVSRILVVDHLAACCVVVVVVVGLVVCLL